MSDHKAPKPPIPGWAWIFAGACFVIPLLTLRGAIPTFIGVFAGLTVIATARQPEKPVRSTVIRCGVVTGSAWTVFVVFLLAVAALQAKHPSLDTKRSRSAKQSRSSSNNVTADMSEPGSFSQPEEIELTEEKRHDIYRMATRTRSHIEFANQQTAELAAKGFDVSSRAKHMDKLYEMQEDRFDFTTRFHKITREQLDGIIIEGDTNNWPTD